MSGPETFASPWSRPLPKRVGLPWKGPVILCDYLYSDEHAATILAFDPESVEVVPWEAEGSAAQPEEG
jgi:hypothetical protein